MTEGVPIADGAATEAVGAAVAGPGAMTLATIWATVDLERTLTGLGVQGPPAVADRLLGARIVVLPFDLDGSRLAIAEPATEGRLAATLARHDEGPVGRYVAVGDDLDLARARADALGIAVNGPGDGPFGPSLLLLTGPVTGPHLILCQRAAVPSTP
jgi:hypothetical protein